MRRMKSGLLIVDMQRGFCPPPGIVEGVAAVLPRFDVVVATRFMNLPESPFATKLAYTEMLQEGRATELALPLPDHAQVWQREGKYGLTAEQVAQLPALAGQWTVVGMDVDACVMAVAFQLWDAGIDFRVPTSLVGSSGGADMKEAGLKLMRRQFGKDTVQ